MDLTDHSEGLKEVWDSFVAQCQTTFPGELTRPLDIRSLQASLSEKVRGDVNGKKTVDYFMRSLACLSKASNILFKAAAVAFPPAEICGNAIKLVIDAARKVHGAFADLIVLVERINAFLETLRLHLDQEEPTHAFPELCNVSRNVLQHFLTVLQVIYKLCSSKRERLKAAFKIFSEDNEIEAARDRMETVIRDFTNTEVAVILQKVSSQARDIGQVRAGVSTLVDGHTLKTIEKALSLHGYGKVGEQNRYQHARLSNRATPGTGQWFIESPEFVSWIQGTSKPVLPIMEVRGSGKTMLTNRVICHLQEKQRPNVFMAYYYNGSPTTLSTLGWILRCLIWQLVQSDEVYAKMVEDRLRDVDISTPLVLWEQFLAKPPDHKPIWLLVVDGLYKVEQRAADLLARIIQDVSGDKTSIRLFLTGQPGSTFHTINIAMKASGWSHVEVTSFAGRDNRRNAEDIRLLVREHLNDSIWTPEDQNTVATSMVKMLNSNNLFNDLISNVRELNKCLGRASLAPKLQEFEVKCREAYIDATALRVARLNKQLGPEQMRELNTILPWVVESGGSCEIALLDEVLRFKGSGNMAGQSIVDRLELYGQLLGPSGRRRRVRFWENIDPFGYMERQRATDREDRPEQSQGRVPRHEVEVMRLFLKTFCKPGLYEKFDFDTFFDSKLSSSNKESQRSAVDSTVRLEKMYSHIDVTKTCLDALVRKKLDGTCRRIHTFSRKHLAELLRYQVLSEADVVAQQEVTSMIAQYIQIPCFPGPLVQKGDKTDFWRLCLAMQKWLWHPTAKAFVEQDAGRKLIEEFRASDRPEAVLRRQKSRDGQSVEGEEDAIAGDNDSDED